MFEFKPLSKKGVAAAVEKAELYRWLNQPWEAESICRDVLAIDPENQRALILLLLALSEQFGEEGGGDVDEAEGLLSRLKGDYERVYFAGIICERRAKAHLAHGTLGAGPVAYEWLRQAMDWFERAESLRPPDNEDALLRWNTCARLIMRNDLRPAPGPPGSLGSRAAWPRA